MSADVPAARTTTRAMRPSHALRSLAPLLFVLAAVAAAAAFGVTGRSADGWPWESRFYGFFFNAYPLFAFAILYALARSFAAAFEPGGRALVFRAAGTAVGCALILAASLHPTFGGITLRAGYYSGGYTFVTGRSVGVAMATATVWAAMVYASVLGGGAILSRGGRFAPGRRFRRRLVLAGVAFCCLWWALAVLAVGRGFLPAGAWPRLPLSAAEAAGIGALVLAAFLPHALILCVSGRQSS